MKVHLHKAGELKVRFLSRASVSQLLESIGQLAEQSRLFSSGGPGLEEELEGLQQDLDRLRSTPPAPEPSQGLTHTHTHPHQNSTLSHLPVCVCVCQTSHWPAS